MQLSLPEDRATCLGTALVEARWRGAIGLPCVVSVSFYVPFGRDPVRCMLHAIDLQGLEYMGGGIVAPLEPIKTKET